MPIANQRATKRAASKVSTFSIAATNSSIAPPRLQSPKQCHSDVAGFTRELALVRSAVDRTRAVQLLPLLPELDAVVREHHGERHEPFELLEVDALACWVFTCVHSSQ